MSTVEYEQQCAQTVATYLEVGFDLDAFDLEKERALCHETLQRAPAAPAKILQDRVLTIADWVGCLLTLPSDFDRGEMLDQLIKYDELRLEGQAEAAEGAEEKEAALQSLFSYGRVIPYLLCRLDVSAHHTVHEHRTPLRTHTLKLLLNVLTGAGDA